LEDEYEEDEDEPGIHQIEDFYNKISSNYPQQESIESTPSQRPRWHKDSDESRNRAKEKLLLTDSELSSIVDENKLHGKLAMIKSVGDMNFANEVV